MLGCGGLIAQLLFLEGGTDMADLKGRVALVTGGGRGIGRATALRLGQDGATVVVNYNASEAPAQEVVGLIESGGGKALAVKADVSDAAQIDAMITRVVKELGGLHI